VAAKRQGFADAAAVTPPQLDPAGTAALALALAVGVACDALLVRMTIVPAVLALAGKHAWSIPRWLDRVLPDLDIEGTSLPQQPAPSAAGERSGSGQHQAAGGTSHQWAQRR
jgi:hypothetical protein